MKEAQVEAGILKYSDSGSGSAIIFLHGTLSNSKTWRKVVSIVSERFRCIAPDLPLGGHYSPLNPEADLSPRGIAVILKQFLDRLGLDRVVLVGNDTGGAYAQVFASMYPTVLSGLVLSNTDAFEIFPPKAFSLLKTGVRIPGFTFTMAQLFRFKPFLKSPSALGLLSHSLTKEQLAELYVRSFIQSKKIREDFIKAVKGWSPEETLLAAEKLKSFDKPALVLWGADDKELFPLELGRRVHAIFPKSTFKIIPDSLTCVQEDQPEAFASELILAMETSFQIQD